MEKKKLAKTIDGTRMALVASRNIVETLDQNPGVHLIQIYTA